MSFECWYTNDTKHKTISYHEQKQYDMLYAHPCVFMQYICKIRPISRMENFYITTIVLIIVFVFPSFLLQYVSCFAGSDIEKWDIIG